MHTGKHMPFHMQKFVDVKMLCYLQVPLATNIAQAGAKEAVATAAAAKELFKADPRICSPSCMQWKICHSVRLWLFEPTFSATQ